MTPDTFSLSDAFFLAVALVAICAIASAIEWYTDNQRGNTYEQMRERRTDPVYLARTFDQKASKGFAGYARVYPVNDPPQRLHTVTQMRARGERIH